MSVFQIVKCDKCGLEFSGCGYYLRVGALKWTGGGLDRREDACAERTFEVCGACAHVFLDPMRMPANDLTGVRQ